MSFTNTTIGHYESVYWDLGNGQTSTAVSPQNINYQQGSGTDTSYTIFMVATNQCGSDTTFETVTFTTGTQVGFTLPPIDDLCGYSFVYDETISFGAMPPDSVIWTFEGGDIHCPAFRRKIHLLLTLQRYHSYHYRKCL
ncbi:MAG: hypothetical protein R2728_09385 [Chitinophagales bacterium]